MELRAFADRCSGVRWLDDHRCQAECPVCASSHDGTDQDYNLIARQVDRRISLVCFGGHSNDSILDAFGLNSEDLIVADIPNGATAAPAETFSTNGVPPYANGRPHSSPATWKILVYRIAKGILEHDAGKDPALLASAGETILLDGVMKDLHRGLTAGTLNPLPDLTETDLEEEMAFAARAAISEFIAAHNPTKPTEPENKEPEDKITVLELGQLYGVIDEWERRPWIWDGILPHSSLSLIVGKSETGKSTLIYSLIYAIVTGSDFFGRQCEQGRVLYLAGDPASEIVAGKTFRALGLEDGVIVIPDALVTHPTGMQQVRAIVANFKPNLIIGDTMAATVDIDVDKYGQSYQAQMPLTKLVREFGPNFLMSHHSQKSAVDSYNVIDAALGSVGVAAVASSRMVTRFYRRKGSRYFTFEMSNLRIGRPLEGEYIIHKLDNGQVELGGLWKIQNTAMDKALIIDVLGRQLEPMAKRTLWSELRPKPRWDPFNDALEELSAQDEIEITNGPRGGRLYQLKRK